jgi:hypothetical protein
MARCFMIFWHKRYQMKASGLAQKWTDFQMRGWDSVRGAGEGVGGFEGGGGTLHCLDRRNITMTGRLLA